MTHKIFNEVEKLTNKYKTRCPYELADALEIIVLSRDLADLKGFYTIENKTRYIAINDKLDEYMQTLICSHELGHDCLHRHFAQYSSLREYTMFDYTGKIEREANIFAADLMIPDIDMVLKTRWENHTFEQIARTLCVPEALLRFKAYSIRKRGYDIHTPEPDKADFLKSI